MHRTIAAAITTLSTAVWLSSAAAQSGCDFKAIAAGTVPVDQSLACLANKITSLETENSRLSSASQIPSGAIVAFDRPNGCPPDWEKFDEGAGRFIIGVGGKYELPYVAGKPRYQKGGSETHTLTAAEMPEHNHYVTVSRAAGSGIHDGLGGSPADHGIAVDYEKPEGETITPGWGPRDRVISHTGGSQPHNNMPPYIALYFCKKT